MGLGDMLKKATSVAEHGIQEVRAAIPPPIQ